jgi:hypothetical protein
LIRFNAKLDQIIGAKKLMLNQLKQEIKPIIIHSFDVRRDNGTNFLLIWLLKPIKQEQHFWSNHLTSGFDGSSDNDLKSMKRNLLKWLMSD